jgi:hypothetical protein
MVSTTEEGGMITRATLAAFVLAGVLIAIPTKNAIAAGGPQVQGVWTCTFVRDGTIERPLMYTFNSDGTFNWSSATTVNSTAPGPLENSGFHSRGGARGEWTRVSNGVYNYKSVEFLYDANGNAAGSFAADGNLRLTSAGQLCSGRAECPGQTISFSLAKYVFDQNDPDADIVGVVYLLPPGSSANVLCNRLSEGTGFPSLPIPMP